MPRVEGLSNEQTSLLRAFRHGGGASPPPQRWPRPTVLRRWMAKPAFRRALQEIREAMELQTGVHLSGAAIDAAYALGPADRRGAGSTTSPSSVPAADDPPARRTAAEALEVLRLIDRRANR